MGSIYMCVCLGVMHSCTFGNMVSLVGVHGLTFYSFSDCRFYPISPIGGLSITQTSAHCTIISHRYNPAILVHTSSYRYGSTFADSYSVCV